MIRLCIALRETWKDEGIPHKSTCSYIHIFLGFSNLAKQNFGKVQLTTCFYWFLLSSCYAIGQKKLNRLFSIFLKISFFKRERERERHHMVLLS